MSKSTKNIIAIVIILVMLICSYFTVDRFNSRMIPELSNNQTEIKDKEIDTNINQTTEDNTTEDSNESQDTSRKNRKDRPSNMPSRPSDDNFKNRNNNFNFDRQDFSSMKRGNNTLFIILYGLESAIIGGCAVYLVLLNSNKLKESNKK